MKIGKFPRILIQMKIQSVKNLLGRTILLRGDMSRQLYAFLKFTLTVSGYYSNDLLYIYLSEHTQGKDIWSSKDWYKKNS